MSTCVTWELTPVKPLQEACICSAYLTFVNLAGEILTPSQCEFCHWFSWIWIGNPEWQHGTNAHVGHPGKHLCEFHYLLQLLCVLPWCHRHPNQKYAFSKCIIPIGTLRSCRLEAARWQQTTQELSNSWQTSWRERPCASAGHQQSQLTVWLWGLHDHI